MWYKYVKAEVEQVSKEKKMVRLSVPHGSLFIEFDDIESVINALREVQKELPASVNGDWREWQHEGD